MEEEAAGERGTTSHMKGGFFKTWGVRASPKENTTEIRKDSTREIRASVY